MIINAKKIGLTGHTSLFLDDGWLFDYIEKINVKLKGYNGETFIDELFSNPKEIRILLKLGYFNELTPKYIESQIQEFKEYYERIVTKIEDKNNLL